MTFAPTRPRTRTAPMSKTVWVFAAAALAAAAPAAAPDQQTLDNWTQWRGPTADGAAAPTADPPVTWGETANIKWKAPLPGRGSATPIVWGDRVFVLTAIQTDRAATPDELPKAAGEKRTTAPTNFYKFDVLC